uniref:HEAT repeat-containing protein n=1 Tax=Kalanchoe fedtschenkoi TaxID=63787 RepID=A0A7N0UIP3_KALFE
MDVERSSLCNCVVNFLLEENYLLTAFELLHELLDDGRDAHAIRLKEFFSDAAQFPPDQITRFNTLRVADPQSLLEEKTATEEKLALTEYELRLAQEDITRLKVDLQKAIESARNEINELDTDLSAKHGSDTQREKRDTTCSDLGPLKDSERRDLNCAVKEYLLIAGYRLTAMTFYEEVTNQNLDVWPKSPASVPDALRHYYYQYLSSTTEAAEEKVAMIRENESLNKEIARLNHDKESLLKNKDLVDVQISALSKSLESAQKDLKEKEKLVQESKQSIEHQRKELNDCRAEITALKVHIEGSRSGKTWISDDADNAQNSSTDKYQEQIKLLQIEIARLMSKNHHVIDSVNLDESLKEPTPAEEKVVEIDEHRSAQSQVPDFTSGVISEQALPDSVELSFEKASKTLDNPPDVVNSSNGTASQNNVGLPTEESWNPLNPSLDVQDVEPDTENTVPGTIQILADALPKIVPYVLINHREELLPLIMCAIERHPDSNTRDSLTHTLFNLIKRPDEQQRRIIMDACVTLAKNVGEMRTETELLPQCWEQINHMYEERRLLVAQSCGQLAEYVRPEIRDSLILSIVQQLLEDSATVVREAAAHNLALLLPLFPNTDKYFKELLPAVVTWGDKLDHVLRVVLSHILGSAQRCPPLSGVENSIESHLRVLGERERWNMDVLLRVLTDLLPLVHQKAINTCPFNSTDSKEIMFSISLLELYARGNAEWPAFEWLHMDCFPDLIQLACLLPQKEDSLRTRITKFLLAVTEYFGDVYLSNIMLPVFLIAVGDDAELNLVPPHMRLRIKGLRPKTALAIGLSLMGVLPILLAGVLGTPSKNEQLAEFLRKVLVLGIEKGNHVTRRITEIVDAVRFLCTFKEHQNIIFNVLWEMVVSSETGLKISAANLLKVIVPYVDAKAASTHILPALVTLASDQNLSVKYASIEAFGSVAQHFKNDMIVDKICVQMDAFLEDGSHESTIAVVRALVVAAPHTTDKLRDYLLSKIFQLSGTPISVSDVLLRRERANAFCEAIRALDATDVSVNGVKDFLIPAIQNLLKDSDAIDPAHKEALEIIMKERSGGTFETISKVMGMGAHLGLASSMTSFFGEGAVRGKKEYADATQESVESPKAPPPPPPVEDTRFRRIMRGGFTDILRGKTKGQEEALPSQS